MSSKYVIYARLEVSGGVEKPDVVGALFGQTEGIFGAEMNLNELQKSGRIGRIDIEVEQKDKGSLGKIVIPSNLDRPMTSLLAATVESVERIGPYTCKVTIEGIVDAREEKRKAIVERGREILRRWSHDTKPEVEDLIRGLVESLKVPEVMQYGPEGLPAGPRIDESGSLIVVEGRADVINLMKNGYENVIALEGAQIPETVIKLSKDKEITVFLDGDRSADLMLRNLLKFVDADFVARAPSGKEVEELSAKELAKALRERVPADHLTESIKERGREGRRGAERETVKETVKEVTREPPRVETPPRIEKAEEKPLTKELIDATAELKGTLESVIFDEKMGKTERMPVSALVDKLSQSDNAYAVVFDGIATDRLVNVAIKKGVRVIIAERISSTTRPPEVRLLTFREVLGS